MKNILIGVLLGVLLSIGTYLLFMDRMVPEKQDLTEIVKQKNDSIEMFSAKVDSLRDSIEFSDQQISALLGQLNAQTAKGSEQVEKVKHLAPDSSVSYFSVHTGRTAVLNSDSTVTTTLPAITNANISFQMLENEIAVGEIQRQLIGKLQAKIVDYAKLDTAQQKSIGLLKGTIAIWQMDNSALSAKLANRDRTIHVLRKYVLVLSGTTGLFFVLLIV